MSESKVEQLQNEFILQTYSGILFLQKVSYRGQTTLVGDGGVEGLNINASQYCPLLHLHPSNPQKDIPKVLNKEWQFLNHPSNQCIQVLTNPFKWTSNGQKYRSSWWAS